MENPYMRYCVQRQSLYTLLRTTETPICATAYNGKSPAQTPTPDRRRPGKSPIQNPGPPRADPGRPLLRTMEIPICVTAYNGNCVQWKSLYALLRTMENHQPKRRPRTATGRENPQSKSPEHPICVTAYNGNPYILDCVQWKGNSPDADSRPPPAGKIPKPKPRTAAGRPLTAVTAYNGNP